MMLQAGDQPKQTLERHLQTLHTKLEQAFQGRSVVSFDTASESISLEARTPEPSGAARILHVDVLFYVGAIGSGDSSGVRTMIVIPTYLSYAFRKRDDLAWEADDANYDLAAFVNEIQRTITPPEEDPGNP